MTITAIGTFIMHLPYLHEMFGGSAPAAPADNARYPGIARTSVRKVLARAAQP